VDQTAQTCKSSAVKVVSPTSTSQLTPHIGCNSTNAVLTPRSPSRCGEIGTFRALSQSTAQAIVHTLKSAIHFRMRNWRDTKVKYFFGFRAGSHDFYSG
jgi:hypothetical protein